MLKFTTKGNPICKIEGGKFNNQYISSSSTGFEDNKNTFNYFKLPKNYDGQFIPIPNPKAQRTIYYIFGPSGSGKSTMCKTIVKEWKKQNKSDAVFLMSAKNEDDSLDDVKPLRIKIDETLIESPLEIEDFKKSLVIFDDYDCITNKKIKDSVVKFLDQCLELGRSMNITVLCTFHLASDRGATKKVLNECNNIIFFPSCGSFYGIKYILEHYVGCDKEIIKRIKKTSSRWVCVYKNAPQCVLSEKEIYTIKDDSDDDDDLDKIGAMMDNDK
jgi:energy-coupling factor transporter ATP-binding protein EcfA2